jgi:hypothetical protein
MNALTRNLLKCNQGCKGTQLQSPSFNLEIILESVAFSELLYKIDYNHVVLLLKQPSHLIKTSFGNVLSHLRNNDHLEPTRTTGGSHKQIMKWTSPTYISATKVRVASQPRRFAVRNVGLTMCLMNEDEHRMNHLNIELILSKDCRYGFTARLRPSK